MPLCYEDSQESLSRNTAPNLWQGGSPVSLNCFASLRKKLTAGRQPKPVSPGDNYLPLPRVPKTLTGSVLSYHGRYYLLDRWVG